MKQPDIEQKKASTDKLKNICETGVDTTITKVVQMLRDGADRMERMAQHEDASYRDKIYEVVNILGSIQYNSSGYLNHLILQATAISGADARLEALSEVEQE